MLGCMVNSYGNHEGYATTVDFMSADRKAFKTAVSEALDGTKNSISLSAEINFRKYDPLL